VIEDVAKRFAAREVRGLAQAITLVERRDPRARELLERLRDAQGGERSLTVGFTGAPGAGKSTLVDAMIHDARERGRTVGVLAVDPSSPFTGGALLGDRLRMDAHLADPGVYVRSMGARGHLGGLAPTSADVAWLLGAFGFDEVLVETVGTGQSEHEIPTIVDTTVVVLAPGMGDSVQLEKAGIMEIADVFAVNKADLDGAALLRREVRTMLTLGPERDWRPRVVLTTANHPQGEAAADELWTAISEHREHLAGDPEGRAATAGRLKSQVAGAVAEAARAWARARLDVDDELAAELVRDGIASLVAQRLTDEWKALIR
jgi:LAO/AO transport system kinase